MRTLFISDTVPYPANSGAKQRTYHVLQALARISEVTLVCFVQPEDDSNNLGSIRHLFVDSYTCPCGNWPEIKSRPIRKLGNILAYLHPWKPASFRWYYSEKAVHLLAELCQQPFQIVWAEKLFSINLLPRMENKRVIFDLHDIESRRLRHRLRQNSQDVQVPLLWLEYVRMRNLERGLRKTSYEITVCSGLDKQALGSNPRVRVIPNGVELPHTASQFQEPENSMMLLYMGTMNYAPNVDAVQFFVHQIFPRVQKKLPRARFVIVGRNPTAAVQRLHNGDSIIVTGTVPDVEIYLSQAAVFVAPIRYGGGTRIKILEALAHRKAVVSTKIGAEGIEGESGKHFILVDEPEEFANACERLVHDRRLREELGEQGYALVRDRYQWKHIERQVESVATTPFSLTAESVSLNHELDAGRE